MNIKLGLSIYNKPWLIESSAAVSLLELWLQISAGTAKWNPEQARAESALHSVLDLLGRQAKVSIAPNNTWDIKEFIANGAFDGASVAVIPIMGPLMKADFCGTPGTGTLKQLTNIASDTSSVKAIIFLMDCPGGTVDGTQALAESIKKSEKQTIAISDGMIASGGYWIASACDKIYASNETDVIGSIGTMITIRDYSESLRQQGIVVYEYYATASTEKNSDFNEAKKGNGKALVQNMLNPTNDIFLKTVRNSRNGRVKEEALSGQIYHSEKAVSLGLIDGIKSVDEVIAEVSGNGVPFTTTKSSINNKLKNTKMTLEQLRTEHPDLYKQVVGIGVNQESERVKTLLVHHAADPERVIKAIKDGEELTPSMREELTLKANSKPALEELKENKPNPVATPDPATAAEEREKAIKASLEKSLDITL